MTTTAIAPSCPGEFVELGASAQGKLFRKHILSTGPLHYGGRTIKIDGKFLDTVVRNFHAQVGGGIVQVPLADSQNRHTEHPLANIGEVVDVQREGGKLYAVIDARDESAAGKLGRTLLGASAFLGLDAVDTRTDAKCGPALYHVAITNRPHVVGLEPFEAIAATMLDDTDELVMLTAHDSGGPAMPGTIELTRDDLDAAYVQLSERYGMPSYVIREQIAALDPHGGKWATVRQEAQAIALALEEPGEAPVPVEIWQAAQVDRITALAHDTLTGNPDARLTRRTPWEQTSDYEAALPADYAPATVAASAPSATDEAEVLRLAALPGPSNYGKRNPQQSKHYHEHDCDALGCENSNVGGNASDDLDARVAEILANARKMGLDIGYTGNVKGKPAGRPVSGGHSSL